MDRAVRGAIINFWQQSNNETDWFHAAIWFSRAGAILYFNDCLTSRFNVKQDNPVKNNIFSFLGIQDGATQVGSTLWGHALLWLAESLNASISHFHNHAQKLKVKTSCGSLDNQTWAGHNKSFQSLFSYSHSCTLANRSVFHSVCQVWMSSACDCETGLFQIGTLW